MERLRTLIRDIPDFPKPGILFKDLTPVLADPGAFAETIDALQTRFASAGVEKVVGIEARGLIFGSVLAHRMGAGFVPVRKPGKLPAKADRVTYDLEYGTDALEMHIDALRPGERTLIIDDLLATGGTARAAHDLVLRRDAEVVGFGFVVELGFLDGRARLGDAEVVSLVTF
jgi:adenine phosphoribosyltransferase